MGYVTGQPFLWPAPPDWADGVQETLTWLTDVMQASGTAQQQARALRRAPRRTFAFTAQVDSDARRLMDAVAFDVGTSAFLLPIYPDVQWIDGIALGATVIPCHTVGLDFAVGGQIALWLDAQHWTLATIASMDAGSITLTAALTAAWPVGTRLYPVRRARLADVPQATLASADAAAWSISALIDEPCDWPPAWPIGTVYRSLPVLEWRGDEGEDPTTQYPRSGGTVDAGTGSVYYFDLPGLPLRLQVQRFVLGGRQSHTDFRALLYALAGRANRVWVSSWQDDLRLASPVTASATQLQATPCGYAVFGYQQRNRRDLRIELDDGTVLYRRVTGSAQTAGGDTLQIDQALGRVVDPSQVRQISWMSLCTLAADAVSITHVTDADGVATCQLAWQAVADDV